MHPLMMSSGAASTKQRKGSKSKKIRSHHSHHHPIPSSSSRYSPSDLNAVLGSPGLPGPSSPGASHHLPHRHHNTPSSSRRHQESLLPFTTPKMLPTKGLKLPLNNRFLDFKLKGNNKKNTVRMFAIVATIFILMSVLTAVRSNMRQKQLVLNQLSTNQHLIQDMMSEQAPPVNSDFMQHKLKEQQHLQDTFDKTDERTFPSVNNQSVEQDTSSNPSSSNNHNHLSEHQQQQQHHQQLQQQQEQQQPESESIRNGNHNAIESNGHPNENSVASTNKVAEDDLQKVLPVEENVPERFEWYTRRDFKSAQRPICRITHALILSNGTILLPDWMEKHEQYLRRCNIGKYLFYTPEVPPTSILTSINTFDYDLPMTVQLDKVQQPTHELPVFFSEHLLKSAFLFQVFSGFAAAMDNESLNEKRCVALSGNNVACDEQVRRPAITGLKPALIVPDKYEKYEALKDEEEKEKSEKKEGSDLDWIHEMMHMVGNAYGNGQGLKTVNISTVVNAQHKHQHEQLFATKVRSILAMDGMFRHMPNNSLKHTRLFSSLNGISKAEGGDHQFIVDSKCKLSIGIAASKPKNENDESSFKKADGLQNNLNMMIKFALPNSEIDIKIVDVSERSLIDRIKSSLQQIDLLIATSGSDLNSIGFLKQSSRILELMPFGIKPIIHKSYAALLGLKYQYLRGRPQDEIFKRCIEHEAGKHMNGPPEWEAPILEAWNKAVAEFTISGSSKFDVLKADRKIRNYQSRICASKQPVDVRLEEAARKVIRMVQDMCGVTVSDKDNH